MSASSQRKKTDFLRRKSRSYDDTRFSKVFKIDLQEDWKKMEEVVIMGMDPKRELLYTIKEVI